MDAIHSMVHVWFCKQSTFILAFLDVMEVDGELDVTLGPCDGTSKYA
jgi:hypothetical protein